MITIKHPWHISIGDRAPDVVKAVIEIPKGSRMKYELDKPSGLLRLDRVLYSAMFYPLNYGLVPQTYFDDGDPLDILVFCSIEVTPLCVVDATVIGIMHMEDENGMDDKILAVAAHDPAYHHVSDLDDIPSYHMEELKHFFEVYKVLEKKKVQVGNMYGREKARECIVRSMELYKEKIGL
ncbi:inorganic pyrophosphatase [Niastella vici]|uniref:Inorganic pyrophosphatase n=1 Tax=Niastella vici TaxID=1703345 RepID=A0A1V9FPB0_9BACT|nr:inorganic diphosphatase [Niastella vici]OQP60183.1 inorganic pyrophosphatase [Niastella vici]